MATGIDTDLPCCMAMDSDMAASRSMGLDVSALATHTRLFLPAFPVRPLFILCKPFCSSFYLSTTDLHIIRGARGGWATWQRASGYLLPAGASWRRAVQKSVFFSLVCTYSTEAVFFRKLSLPQAEVKQLLMSASGALLSFCPFANSV